MDTVHVKISKNLQIRTFKTSEKIIMEQDNKVGLSLEWIFSRFSVVLCSKTRQVF